MSFPDIRQFPEAHPGPYERQMGRMIARILDVLNGHVPDSKSHAHVTELANEPARWSAGHAVFDSVRDRYLLATNAKGSLREWQYSFEESCCQALYNATDPRDPFDPSSAFFVVPQALRLAQEAGVPLEKVIAAIPEYES